MSDPKYGDPLAFVPGQIVERPDGTSFVQGDPSTYTFTELPPVTRPEGYGSTSPDPVRPGGRVPSVHTALPALFLSPAAIVERVSGPRLEPGGRWWETTYRTPDRPDYTIRTLRHSREGNG